MARAPRAPRLPLHADLVLLAQHDGGSFAKLAKRRLKRAVFRSIADLQAAINLCLDEHNDEAKPFSWTADPDKIIAVV